VLKPVDLSYERAAALPTVGVTAYQATAEVRPGQAVFVNGCLGGVGRAAVQFAQARGASVASSCRDAAADEARELGVEPVVGFGFDPAALAGRFDLVFDSTACFPSPRPERC
jgi:NADPH:quinone reductase-like Zn-dependent oxidoreductase